MKSYYLYKINNEIVFDDPNEYDYLDLTQDPSTYQLMKVIFKLKNKIEELEEKVNKLEEK